MHSQPILSISSVVKKYGKMTALHGINFDVEEGEFVALVGPSGSGKSTLLKCIAGFEDISDGELDIAGVPMRGVSPANRPTSMVFQKLALFPHKTVAENIAFPLKLQKRPKSEMNERVAKMMELMALNPDYLTRFPAQLSGGEQQRVALARSMISSPKLLLLDEPLSALDVKLKKVLQAELKRLHRQLGVTFVHVTHDLEEALMLADRVCVMNHGRLEQIGTPHDIYYRPATRFVASFISETNLFDIAIMSIDADMATFDLPRLLSGPKSCPKTQVDGRVTPGTAQLMVRPERLRPITDADAASFKIDARVDEVFMKGSITQFVCNATQEDHTLIRLIMERRGEARMPFDVGDVIQLGFDLADVYVFQDIPQTDT